ncbi:MAG: helix-turn-helix domain-containing protein [Oscillospiraceae bacterium]|nr:helix-turn-helix domain-containing protein [Oscillospiraceae bacterium]
MKDIGSRIKKVRVINKFTQREFSKSICISQPHLSEIENNKEKPSKAVIRLISILFKVSEEWLINGSEK